MEHFLKKKLYKLLKEPTEDTRENLVEDFAKEHLNKFQTYSGEILTKLLKKSMESFWKKSFYKFLEEFLVEFLRAPERNTWRNSRRNFKIYPCRTFFSSETTPFWNFEGVPGEISKEENVRLNPRRVFWGNLWRNFWGDIWSNPWRNFQKNL